jgi:diamine N-acetyltransferase
MLSDNLTRLRALEPDDLDILYNVENDVALWAVGNTNAPYSREVLRQYLLSTTCDIYTDKQLRLVVETHDGEAVGMVDLLSFDAMNARAEVGIVTLAAHRQKGYGRSALRQLVGYSREVLHLHQLYAYVASDNQPSLRLFQSCGFVVACELRDWLKTSSGYQSVVLMQRVLG